MNPDISSNIQTLFIEEEATLFKIYWGYFFANGKARDIKGYQAKILNTEGPILIPLIHKLLNLVGKKGFPNPWTQSLNIPIFKNQW